jgi:hypothetical protein
LYLNRNILPERKVIVPRLQHPARPRDHSRARAPLVTKLAAHPYAPKSVKDVSGLMCKGCLRSDIPFSTTCSNRPAGS